MSDALLARIDDVLSAGAENCPGIAEELLRACRAALAERIPREPTEAMIVAGLQADDRMDLPTAVWQAMYDAAVPGIPRERDAERLERENAELRVRWAVAYAGMALYSDDGELQDGRESPFIDFKRDTLDEIDAKMLQRAARAIAGDSHG